MNKIYRVIWNSTLGQWIVTSELGRGKIKRATRKALLGVILGAASATPSFGSECDVEKLTCELDSSWGADTNNQGEGSISLSDGLSWTIYGPDKVNPSGTSYKVLSSINQGIVEGYIEGNSIAPDSQYVSLGNLSRTVSIYDPITNSNRTVSVYDSNQIVSRSTDIIDAGVMKIGPVETYNASRFATISNGSDAKLDLGTISITGGIRDSQFIYIDGNNPQKTSATIDGKVNLNFGYEPDYSLQPTISINASKSTYKGAFTTFNGGTFTVNSISELQSYNNWLVEKLESGELQYGAYSQELGKAYLTTTTPYTINKISEFADPDVIITPTGITALMYATGSNAVASLADSAVITGTVGQSVNTSAVFSLHNKAKGVNNGISSTYYRTAIVDTGASFVNNNTISNGPQNGNGISSSIKISDMDSTFINNGNLYVVPASWSTVPVNNGLNVGVDASNNASVINNGTIYASSSEPALGHGLSGNVYGISLKNASGLNAQDAKIYVGHSESSGDVYSKPNSAGVYAYGKTNFNNEGVISLGKKTDGSYGIYTYVTFVGSDVKNSGKIIIDSNGDGGKFTPGTNIGIYSTSSSRGVSNEGVIDVNGINTIGIKALSSSIVTSPGTINLHGSSDPSTGFRNYGAWSEGSGSLIDISGNVNLNGNGAIGIHARGQGAINLSGAGKVNFSNGENQIGYYIYGAGSRLNNTSSGVQDVTTNNSTLMRLDGGASFTGAAGATSTMSASGNNSTVIVATGTGTSINSGGMTLNVNGQDATGVLVEGGATGTITDTAGINLSGAGAVAGIADGQGHDLTGAATTMTDAQKKATTLTAAASLLSSLDDVTGYIARNLATLNNSGNINFTGNNATGIQVAEGATGSNSGNIVLGGAGSVGLEATASTTATKLSSTGSLSMNGDWDGSDVATRATGVLAQGSKVDVTIGDGTTTAFMNLNGAGSVGVHAKDGSNVLVKDKVQVSFDGNKSDQVAFWADGAGSTILTGSTAPTSVSGDGATMFYVTDTATMAGDVKVNLSGKAGSSKTTSGVRVSDAGSQATLGANSQVTIGTNATGVLAEKGGKAVIAQGATFSTSGANAIVGQATDSGSLVENNATVTSLAGSSGSTGFLALNDGTVDNKGAIDFSAGSGHTAIDVNNGHVTNTGNIAANGTAIHIKGAASTISNSGTITAVDGLAAIHVDAGAGLDLGAVSGNGTIVAKGSADGILLDTGATSLNVANTLIDMSDASATGIGIHNVAGISGIRLDNTTINLGGSGIGV
ncbi:ESPR domain-containing protein, partial [Buttiauxella noackiae]|uniref:ESPR domain-containing protein n=1 Tax=Buttiauxella noackiae TaxID=82992 RepID=UPI002357A9F4